MPTLPTAPDCAKVELIGHQDGQEWVNVHHFTKSSFTPTDVANLSAALFTWWTNYYAPCLGTLAYIDYIRITDLRTPSGPVSTGTFSPPDHGTVNSAGKPNNCAVVVTKRTAGRGRSYRGRTYVPGITDAVVTEPNSIDTTWLGQLLTAFARLVTPANVAGFTWSVLSYYLNNAVRSSGLATPITAVTADATLDSMRRRLPLRGA